MLEKQRLVASLVGEVARMKRAFERVLKKAEEAKGRRAAGGGGGAEGGAAATGEEEEVG